METIKQDSAQESSLVMSEPQPTGNGLRSNENWRPMSTAPREGLIMLLLGETIPGHPLIEVGRFEKGDDAEELGYREYAKYGGWLIWNGTDNFFVIDITEPEAWAPLPGPIGA